MNTPAPARGGLSPQRLERITTHLQQHYIEPGKIAGCQLLVAHRGEARYFRSFGRRDLARDLPMRDDTIFRIYSMTKPITSIALMQLYERGLFQLNEPVSRVIPEFGDLQVWVSGEGRSTKTEALKRPITFGHLLSHRAGLTYGGGLNIAGEALHPVDQAYRELNIFRNGGDDLATFVRKLGQVPLRYQPGERWMYSLATDVCGYLVQALSGQRFDHYLREHVFEPLGMHDTAFSIAPDKLDRFACNYTRAADRSLKLMDDAQDSRYAAEPALYSGGGGLVSTTADYWRFCEMLRRGGQLDGQRIIGSRTLKLMTKNHLPGGSDLTHTAIGVFSETTNEGVGFGLGFASPFDAVAAGTLATGDFYWGGLASTLFWVDPQDELVVIFMTQLVPSSTFNFRGQLKNLVYSSFED